MHMIYVDLQVANEFDVAVCGQGYYGTTTCTLCPEGQYNDAYGQTTCTMCPAHLGRTTLLADKDKARTAVTFCQGTLLNHV